MGKQRRTVVEIREDLHQEIRRMAVMNDVKIYMFTNALVEAALKDQEKIKAIVKKLKLEQQQ